MKIEGASEKFPMTLKTQGGSEDVDGDSDDNV